MENTLKVYRASAGSGKTFTLALEYMKLLVENPYSYRNILAVTFTKKATGEMKERILGKLYGVANGLESARDYLDKIVEQLPHLDKDTIIRNAGLALNLILHDYGHFRIQTIDAFFQTVLRSLAKELDLNGDMEISLDGETLLEDAVDSYIRNLEPEAGQIAPIIDFIEDKIVAGNDWHVGKDLKDFAKNILSEEYQQRGESLRKKIEEDNGRILKDFYKLVSEKRKAVIKTAESIGERFFVIADGYTEDDFSGKKRGIWGFFNKLKNGEIPVVSATNIKLIENPQKISSVCGNVEEIAELIKKAIPLYREKNNCDLSLKHYHQLGMLNSIAKTLKEENEKENRFLLAETTHLLSSMIKENATFIFEKIGTEIDHIFIDEFQDTSQLQWNCFKVLLEEVLGRESSNLIVGDVKQSIYRWRNSDWNIMNNIGNEFRKDQITFADQSVINGDKTFHSTNFRSDSNIVTFNNALFRTAVDKYIAGKREVLGDKLEELFTAYEDVEQALPAWRKPDCGYVELRMLAKNDKKEKLNGYAIKQLMSTLHMLLEEKNIAPGKITILLRTKSAMKEIVDAFNLEFPDIKIVSDEAYRLSASLTLQLVVCAMRYIASPEDRVNVANLVKLYNKVVNKHDEAFADYKSYDELIEILPLEFRERLTTLRKLPVYELIEQLLQEFGMSNDKDEEAYVYAFLDYATQYLANRTSDLNGFINAWDNEICEKSIPAEEVNSVRLMTIHKSKGLEFHTVIIPLCDWYLSGDSRGALWCNPKEAPYNTLSLLSVPLKKDMLDSIYSEDYNKEQLYQIVDNLNILYVATTRAKTNLFIFGDKTGGNGETVSKMLNEIIGELTLDGSTLKDDVYTYGTLVNAKEPEKEKKDSAKTPDNPFEAKPENVRQPFVYHKNRITFRQSRDLERFITSDQEKEKQLKHIAEGELLHLVMSGINNADDVEKALDKLTVEGLIATEERYNKIKRLIEGAIANPKAKDWFAGKYKLYNECAILVGDSNSATRRPDRVMIRGNEAVVVDYKFGNRSEEYNKQVQRYMALLSQMGYENVKGYLWYVYKNVIEEV